MIKKNWVYLLFACSLVFFISARFFRKNHKGEIKTSLQTFRTGLGWGYDLYVNDTVYIHQEYMPAASGRKGFETEADARKIGTLALNKMAYSRFPVISVAELDSCGIKR
jgi:hypothetical protein